MARNGPRRILLWHNADGVFRGDSHGVELTSVRTHIEVWPVSGPRLRARLAQQFRAQEGKPPTPNAVGQALEQIKAKCLDMETILTKLRTARDQKAGANAPKPAPADQAA